MSKTLVGGCAGTQYGCCADGTTSKNSDGSNCPKREYDQILSGDVKIKKIHNSNKEYQIKFSKKNISKMLMYQTWSSTSAALNGDRRVGEVKAKNWVKVFFPKTPYATYAIPFTPTTVMEIGNNKHVFVINNAKVKEGRVVFYVSSKDIDLNNTNKVIKKLKKIPTTKKGEMFRRVRFDIDDTFAQCQASTQCWAEVGISGDLWQIDTMDGAYEDGDG